MRRVLHGIRRAGASDLLRGVATNSTARVLAIVGLTLATVVVARVGGASAVGSYALLRMLPGLVGVVSVAGLPGAQAYFLAAPRRGAPRLWPTLMLILIGGAALGSAAWVAAAPVLRHTFFREDTTLLVAAAGATVASQLFLTAGKTALQGLEDRRGGDIVIASEELAFLPCYGAVVALGWHGTAAIILGLGLADLVVGTDAWRRVVRRMGWSRGGFAGPGRGFLGRPDRALFREVVTYGLRGQAGGILTLLNLRLDFAILGAMAGPAVLGVYAVASKYAELLRLPGTALTWVSYPRMAALSPDEAGQRARRLLLPCIGVIVTAAIPLALLCSPVMTLLYGQRFHSAVAPAQVLLVGMLLGGASGVASGYLYGRGRPGMNSLAMGCGVAVTVGLDLLLIPKFGVMGASVASTAAYLTSDVLLIMLLLRVSGRPTAAARRRTTHAEVPS